MTLRRHILLLLAIPTAAFLVSASGCEGKTGQGEAEVASVENTHVKIETPFGDMVAVLYDETPLHRDNFIKLADSGFYDGLLFHRVMKNFMVQGGDPNSKGAAPGVQLGNGGPGYTVPAEFNNSLVHVKGALAAARQPDRVNPQKASSGSQFYVVQGTLVPEQVLLNEEKKINARRDSANHFHYSAEAMKQYTEVGGTQFLDQNYTVFGQVIEGLNVIDSITTVAVDSRNRPLEDLQMKVSVIRK